MVSAGNKIVDENGVDDPAILVRTQLAQALATLREHGLVLTWAAPGRARIVVLTEPGSSTPLAIA